MQQTDIYEYNGYLGIVEDSSANKCFIWGNMELRTLKVGRILPENGHHEA